MSAAKAVTSSWRRPFALATGRARTWPGNIVLPRNFFHFAEAPDWLYDLVLTRPEPNKARARTRAGDNEFVSAVIGEV